MTVELSPRVCPPSSSKFPGVRATLPDVELLTASFAVADSPGRSRSSSTFAASDVDCSGTIGFNRTEPYYSNDDIQILHAIVVSAQEDMLASHGPRPLPVAALFKAYDRILPHYGLDPDEDQHISTFLFRIGGEDGSGTLTNKFQAILSRMGIVLEFGDSEETSGTPSARSSQSAASPDNSLISGQGAPYPHRSSYGITSIEKGSSLIPSLAIPIECLNPKNEPPTFKGAYRMTEVNTSLENHKNGIALLHTHNSEPDTSLFTKVECQDEGDAPNGEDNQGIRPESNLRSSFSLAQKTILSSAIHRWRKAATQNEDQVHRKGKNLSWGMKNRALSAIDQGGSAGETGHFIHALAQESNPPTRHIPFSVVSPIAEELSNHDISATHVASSQTFAERDIPLRNQDHMGKFGSLQKLSKGGLPPAKQVICSENFLGPSISPPTHHSQKSPMGSRQDHSQQPLPGALEPELFAHDSVGNEQRLHHSAGIELNLRTTLKAEEQGQPSKSIQNRRCSDPTLRTLIAALSEDQRKRNEKTPSHNLNSFQGHPVAPLDVNDNAPVIVLPVGTPLRPPLQAEALGLENQDALNERHLRQLARASRAREIYLASKVFSHWADKTARRLEREAVARRHMIRFRCFGGWVERQTSKLPVAAHIRKGTALQKLKRAIAEHDEQLRLAASAVADSYRMHRLCHTVRKWSHGVIKQQVQKQAVIQTRKKAIVLRILRVHGDSKLDQVRVKHSSRHAQDNNFFQWRPFDGHGVIHNAASAKLVGGMCVSQLYLRKWLNQAEGQRRSTAYLVSLFKNKTGQALDKWNIQTRSQAYIWRRDYISVSETFDLWFKRAREGVNARHDAQQILKAKMKKSLFDRLRGSDHDRLRLERIQNCAVLYILAIRTISIMEEAVKKRKVTEWYEVRCYLAKRYQEVSLARKKRIFFWVLDRWRTAAARIQLQGQISDRSRQLRETRCGMAALETWTDWAINAGEMHNMAHTFRFQCLLRRWRNISQFYAHQDKEAHHFWATGKMRQYQKIWSISAMQQSGLAHTAAVVGQRCNRDRRNRLLQYWRQLFDKEKSAGLSFAAHRDSMAVSNPRSAWKSSSIRKSLARRYNDPLVSHSGAIETPTRWTGRAITIDSIFSARPMPVLRKINEEITAGSEHSDDGDMVASPSVKLPTGISSTTPRAPVPTHLNREFEDHLSQSELPNQIMPASPAHWQSSETRRKPLHANLAALTAGQLGFDSGNMFSSSLSKPRTLSRPSAAKTMLVDISKSVPVTPKSFHKGGKSRSSRAPGLRRQYTISQIREPSTSTSRDVSGAEVSQVNRSGVHIQ